MIQVECSVCKQKIDRPEPNIYNKLERYYCSRKCYYARGSNSNARSGAYRAKDGTIQRFWSFTISEQVFRLPPP